MNLSGFIDTIAQHLKNNPSNSICIKTTDGIIELQNISLKFFSYTPLNGLFIKSYNFSGDILQEIETWLGIDKQEIIEITFKGI